MWEMFMLYKTGLDTVQHYMHVITTNVCVLFDVLLAYYWKVFSDCIAYDYLSEYKVWMESMSCTCYICVSNYFLLLFLI